MNIPMSLAACRVVLVRTHVAGNLGATARVMRNLGLSDLVLVAPIADPTCREARRLSTHGESILTNALIVPDLGSALSNCLVVAATSARIGKRIRGQFGAPEQIMPHLVEAMNPGPVALVFGPEPSGLTDEEIARCHWLLHIPTDVGYPALNLAQAVAICLHELRRAWLAQATTAPFMEAAPFAVQERMFAALREALEEIHFLYGPKADALMHALRHLIGRAQPTVQEVKLLHGLARQIHWYATRAEEN
jgi:tRNA/rRNA methyltransferase